MTDAVDIAEQFEKHIGSPKQTWLLGAGVSFGSNIPLMNPLTTRVMAAAKCNTLKDDAVGKMIIDFVTEDISELSNIEDFLTHLGDLISIAERSRTGSVRLNGESVAKDKLVFVHRVLLELIADTVRWGYKEGVQDEAGKEICPELIGTKEKSIVTINEHLDFVKAIFGSIRAGLEVVRSPVEFFTTNYDTLLEDALALNQIQYIDWQRDATDEAHLFRIRDGDTYPAEGGVVMIYPQATKYLNAQRDPFAELFQRFRQRLENSVDQVLLVCGYSFGDEHINAEIELALRAPKSQLTLVAFADQPEGMMPSALEAWRKHDEWGSQVFVAGSRGLYQGRAGPHFPDTGSGRDWWTFGGVTRLLSEGLPEDVLEATQ